MGSDFSPFKHIEANISKIFRPFRCLGVISNHVACCTERNGDSNFITCSVGRVFHIYEGRKLRLICASEPFPNDISSLTNDGSGKTIVSYGSSVSLCERGKIIKTYSAHQSDISLILSLGEYVVSLEKSGILKIWNIHSLETYFEVNLQKDEFKCTAICHPHAYVNKILLGSADGSMQLWNIQSGRNLHNFSSWNSAISCIEQSTAIDVVAVGLDDGRIILHNLAEDCTLLTLSQEWGCVTHISFRTDNVPHMATSSSSGHVSIWDLEKAEILTCIMRAHEENISLLHYYPGEPVLLTAGSDNSLKQWLFDESQPNYRLLKSRHGFSKPLENISFLPSESMASYLILSSAIDGSLWLCNTYRDEQLAELSQGQVHKYYSSSLKNKKVLRLPKIISFAFESGRQGFWENCVTCHHKYRYVRSWKISDRVMSKKPIGKDVSHLSGKSFPLVCAMSSCGSFTIVGYSDGFLEKFNVQSTFHRGSYLKDGAPAHASKIVGVSINATSSVVISSGEDKVIRMWNFESYEVMRDLETDFIPMFQILNRDSNLLAVCSDRYFIKVYDLLSYSCIRIFDSGQRKKITSMTFSPDGKWLVTGCVDKAIRVWDLSSSRLVDYFSFHQHPQSLSFSNSGDFLAVSFFQTSGIYLWYNQKYVEPISLDPLPNNYSGPVFKSTEFSDNTSKVKESKPSLELSDVSELETLTGHLTLSLIPESRWKILPVLNLYKEKSKPKEPIPKIENAPFFLPTISGLKSSFNLETEIDKEACDQSKSSKVRMMLSRQEKSSLLKAIQNFESQPQSAAEILNSLIAFSPTQLGAFIESFANTQNQRDIIINNFIRFLTLTSKTSKNFDFLQGLIGMFLNIHMEQLSSKGDHIELLRELKSAEEKAWSDVGKMIDRSMCTISYLTSGLVKF